MYTHDKTLHTTNEWFISYAKNSLNTHTNIPNKKSSLLDSDNYENWGLRPI